MQGTVDQTQHFDGNKPFLKYDPVTHQFLKEDMFS